MNRETITSTGRGYRKAAGFRILLVVLCCQGIFVFRGFGQAVVDDELRNLFMKENNEVQDHKAPLKESRNEIKATFSLAFLAYKTLLSSQDQPSCVFTPSCSEFAIEALTSKGLFPGWLYTFDRLSRCHGFVNPRHYAFNKTHNRFYDPIK
jgi:putative component of membrane protein insertase Oxa1/YidC/SpoIIIJ protein YidD